MIGTQKGKFILRKHFIIQISVLHRYNGKFSKLPCHYYLHQHTSIMAPLVSRQISRSNSTSPHVLL